MARTSFGRGARQVAASAALVVGALTSFGAALTLDATGAHGITLAACTDSWTGSAGDGNWSTAGNWLTSSSTQAVPTSSDVACIGNNTSTTPFTVTLSSSVSVAALELGGNTASTLNSTNDAVNLGNASNDPSEIFSNGIINLTSTTGDAELFNANSSIVTQVDSGGQVNAITNGSSATYIGNTGTLTINGALNVSGTGTGQTELYNGVTVVNNGSIDVTANTLSDASSGSFTNNGTITNAATVNLSTDYIDRGSAVGANPVNFQGGTFDDDTGAGGGTYTASGSIILKGTGSNPGLSTGQTLDLNNVTGTNEATTFTVDGTINLTSTTGDAELFNNVVGDAITVASGGQVDAITNGTSATYIGNTGTLTINSGGALNVSGTGTGAGETQLYNAVTVVNNGSIDVTANTLYVPTNGGFTNNGTITNAATVNLSTDYIDRGSAAGANPVNFQGGTFDDDTGAGGGTYTASGSIILKGTGSSPGIPPTQTLDLNGVTGTNEATTFTVDGTINLNVTSGSPQFFNNVVGDTITLASGATAKTLGSGSNIAYFGNTGTLNIAKGATVDLTATNDQFYNAVAVTDNGTVTVPAGSNLTIGNTFTQGRFGTLAVTNNVTASTKSVITGGTDSLGGTLDVTTVGTPSVAYSPLSAMSSRTGFFGTLNYHGTSYSTAYTSSPNDVTLTPTSSAYGYAGLTLSSTSVGATGVDYSLKLQGQAMTAGTTSFTVTAPAGTTFPTYTSNCNVVLFDDITSSASENCLGSIPVTGGGGTTLTFTAPISAAATDTVQIDILDVTNAGPAASDGLTVNNGSVSVQLGYTLTPSTSVTNATITASSDSDQATHVVYTTTFTATNGLTSDGYSTITLTFPSDYTPPTYTSNCNQTIIEDLTTATSDSCSQVTPTTSGQSVTYEVPIAIAPGDRVEIAWSGVTNPSSSTGPQAIQIATSADPTATGFTPPLSLVAPTSVSNGTLTSVSSTSESASQVAYTTTFKATNSLIAGNATISLTLPSGYSTPAYTSNCNFITIVDETTSNSENCAQANPTTSGQTITFVPLISINPGDTVQVVWYGISNPASVTNPLTFELNTSGDPVLDNLAPQVNLTSPTGVGSLTISPSNATAGTSGVTYTANFTTTNSLVSETNANSVITMAFPTGTGLPSITTNCGQVVLDDLTTTTDYSCSPSTPTVSGETLTYAVPADIAAGDHLQLQVLGVTNPTSTSCTGSQSASLDTSADPMSESASYTIASASLAPVLAVPTVGPGQVNLSWSAPTCTNGSPISSYTVLRGTSSGSETPLQTGITGTTYQDTAVNAGTAYFYKVEAVNGVGASPPSNEESATPLVTPENTTTALTPTIATSTTYGSETTETFAGTVTGQSGDGFPQGTVTVFYGSPTQTQLCHATLSGGSGDVADFSCSLTATQLAAGSFTNVVATYAAGTSSNGNFSYNTSTSSPAQSFTVSPEAENTTTALNAVTPSVTFGSETTETFAGTVTGQSGDGFPQGTVTVFY
ncbi:MAG TPA: fibronectin type III domain-containing protein, partial [Acidimicrobiales bacterium]|nr:fibronectin type III domain-containing protein [Acidimicrobiales bacterium]